MRILLLGGTGFIGRSLCRDLQTTGNQLFVLSRHPERVPLLCPGAIGVADLAELDPLGPFEAIVNLAGEPIFGPRWTPARKLLIRDSRIALTDRLLAWIDSQEYRPSVLINGSAIGIYGDRGGEELDEQAALGSGFGAELCAAWEHAALAARGLGIRVCLLRTGLVLGPEGGFLRRMLPPFRLGLGGRIGDGRQWMSWIHLSDHLAAMRLLLEDSRQDGAFNLSAPNPVTNAEFTTVLARVLSRPALLPLPASLLKLLFGEMAELLLGSQRVIPARLAAAGFQFRYPGLEAALRDVLGC